MKTDKENPMTDRQIGQLERLGIPFDRSMTIHEAARLASQRIAEFEKEGRCRKCGGDCHLIDEALYSGKEVKMIDCMKCTECGWSVR